MPRGRYLALSGAGVQICRSLLDETEISLNLERTASLTFEMPFAWFLCGEISSQGMS